MLSRAMSVGDLASTVTLSEDDYLPLQAGPSTVTDAAVLLGPSPSWRASASLISSTAPRLQQTQITPAAQDLLTRRMLRLLTPVINVVVAAARKHSAQPTRVVIDAKDWGETTTSSPLSLMSQSRGTRRMPSGKTSTQASALWLLRGLSETETSCSATSGSICARRTELCRGPNQALTQKSSGGWPVSWVKPKKMRPGCGRRSAAHTMQHIGSPPVRHLPPT